MANSPIVNACKEVQHCSTSQRTKCEIPLTLLFQFSCRKICKRT